MLSLATISDMSRLAVLLDTSSCAVDAIPVRPEFADPKVEGRPKCRPLGISRNAAELFIVNNRLHGSRPSAGVASIRGSSWA